MNPGWKTAHTVEGKKWVQDLAGVSIDGVGSENQDSYLGGRTKVNTGSRSLEDPVTFRDEDTKESRSYIRLINKGAVIYRERILPLDALYILVHT